MVKRNYSEEIDYSKYNTMDFETYEIYESKGIPNVIKWLYKRIYDDLKNEDELIINISETNFKLQDLKVKLSNESYCTFGKFEKDKLIGSEIFINNLNPECIKYNLIHELTHLYEIYNRYINKTNELK